MLKKLLIDNKKYKSMLSKKEKEKNTGLFDPEWYCSNYPDVSLSGLSPEEHFFHIGQKIGRAGSTRHSAAAIAAEQKYATDGIGYCEKIAYNYIYGHKLSIAAVTHVFYEDLIDEVCSYLKNIPDRFSGFFAVREAGMEQTLRQALAKYGVNCETHILVAPNRGRNFGAFLVDFREQLRKHDLCVHIHTKKSLRTGREEYGWRNHLFQGLLGSCELVQTIVGKFASDQQVGMIYPVTWPNMPIWCHNWLRSSHRIGEICSKLGIDKIRRRGFIDMPVGSMFWARTNAIAKLLDYSWSYEDFEAEPIGDDGSMAHVIERALTGVCRWHGFDYVEIDSERNVFRRNWGTRCLDSYPQFFDSVRWCADNCDKLSFDFYDTLFCRKATTPDDVHNYIGWVLHARGLVKDEEDFYLFRKQAENHSRQTCLKGDVDIDDIYLSFPSICNWNTETIQLARQLELDIEASCLVPRRDVIALARTAKSRGASLLVVSDSYMPKRFFEQVLSRHGMCGLFDRLYISADVGMRKDRGDIWPYLFENEVNGQRFWHWGDNEHSDIQNTLAHNIDRVYLLNTTVMASLCGLGPQQDWQIESPRWRDGLVHGPIIARFCSDGFLHRKSFRPLYLENPEDIGFAMLGPIYLGFMTWLSQQLRSKKTKKLFFFGREGWFLLSAYQRIRSLMQNYGRELPEGRYLAVSRRLVMGAMASVSFEPDFIMRGSRFEGTLESFLLARLGFRLDPKHPLSGSHFNTETQAEMLRNILIELQPKIIEHSKALYTRLLNYLSQEEFAGDGLSVVDLGYSGTIQSALQCILGQRMEGYYMVTSLAAADVRVRGGEAHGYFSHDYSPSAVRDFSMILEGILTAPHGQVIDYIKQNNYMTPVYKEEGFSQKVFSYLESLNSGANEYLNELFKSYGPEIGIAEYSPEECDWGIRAMVEGVIKFPEEFWKNICVEDNFCGNDELNVGKLYNIDPAN